MRKPVILLILAFVLGVVGPFIDAFVFVEAFFFIGILAILGAVGCALYLLWVSEVYSSKRKAWQSRGWND
ncbi:MAG: hypothetical protein WDO14_06640 [Bacteroidota bacterium]